MTPVTRVRSPAPTFYPGGSYPAHYNNGLFFADYARQCLFFMPAGTNGLPDAGRVEEFSTTVGGSSTSRSVPAATSTTSTSSQGSIHHISYDVDREPPADRDGARRPERGRAPSAVQFHGDMSTDPDGDALTYAWDLDGDGAFDDSTAANPTHTYATNRVGERASPRHRLAQCDEHRDVTVNVGGGAGTPVPMIGFNTQNWYVGQPINFTGVATDPEDGAIPPSELKWSITLFHCPNGDELPPAPPSGSGGAASVHRARPRVLRIPPVHPHCDRQQRQRRRCDARPATADPHDDAHLVSLGCDLGFNDEAAVTPFSRTVIRFSTNTISAPADGGDQRQGRIGSTTGPTAIRASRTM